MDSLFKIALFGLVRTPVSTQDWISINQPIIVTLPWEVPHLCHLPPEAGVGICCHQGVKWLTSTFPRNTRPVWGESQLLFVSLHSQLATCVHFESCTMNAPSKMGSKKQFLPPSLPLWCPVAYKNRFSNGVGPSRLVVFRRGLCCGPKLCFLGKPWRVDGQRGLERKSHLTGQGWNKNMKNIIWNGIQNILEIIQ